MRLRGNARTNVLLDRTAEGAETQATETAELLFDRMNCNC